MNLTNLTALSDKVKSIKTALAWKGFEDEISLEEQRIRRELDSGEMPTDVHFEHWKVLQEKKKRYQQISEAFQKADGILEEIHLFQEELAPSDMAIMHRNLTQTIRILEHYQFLALQGISLEDRTIHDCQGHCKTGYSELEDFYMKDFGAVLPERMKFPGELIVSKGETICMCELDCRHFCKKTYTDKWQILVEPNSLHYKTPLASSAMSQYFRDDIHLFYAIGYYSRGDNNNAFYYIRADGWRKLYFRLQLGGIYSKSDQGLIGKFLKKYNEFETRIEEEVDYFTVKHLFGRGEYSFFKNGKIYSTQIASLENANFERMFEDLLAGLE